MIRFQNPGSQTPESSQSKARLPLLLGIVKNQSGLIIVGADANRRLGSTTRFSVLFLQSLIQEATARGWASYVSTAGEIGSTHFFRFCCLCMSRRGVTRSV